VRALNIERASLASLLKETVPMIVPIRPPPKVLILHSGIAVETYLSVLRAAGLEATEAHGDDAVAQVAAIQPDIIVLDFACDGETMAALRSDERTSNIPVIALAELPAPHHAND
jgi:CheY-like chemotaxis protein